MGKRLSILILLLLAEISYAQTVKFQKKFNHLGGGDDDGFNVIQTFDGGYALSGTMSNVPTSALDMYLIKTNSWGDTLWTKLYGGAGVETGYSIQQCADSGFILSGSIGGFGARDMCLIKTNSLGDTLWTKTYGGPADDSPGINVCQTTDGGYFLAGSTTSFGSGNWDWYVVKTNAIGDTLWTKTYGGIGEDDLNGGYQTLDGGYILIGGTKSFGVGDYDILVIKIDSIGNRSPGLTCSVFIADGLPKDFANSRIPNIFNCFLFCLQRWIYFRFDFLKVVDYFVLYL